MSDSKHLTVACPSCGAQAGVGCVIAEPRGKTHDGGLWMWHSSRWPSSNDATDEDWKVRAIAAEQRAEAAEAERDRMGSLMRAPSFPLTMWAEWARELYANNHRSLSGLSGHDHALLTAIDAYRAGHPATSEAERIAAWLIREEADDTSRGQFACFLADQIRAGAWRKGQG